AVQRVRDRVGQHVFPVHRLDRSTSGVLVFALSSDAAARLSAAFTARSVDKRYLAVVRGTISDHGTVDYALRSEPGAPLKPAVTDFRRLDTTEVDEPVPPHPTARDSLVALRPRTGRTHQLRRHMAHLRHPIVGDVRHGDGAHNRLFRRRFDSHRLLLWATDLSFEHPFTGARLALHAPPAQPSVLRALGFTPPEAATDFTPP
ncbi:MAG: pseudouridine synthase, partial [Myxococcota bacterium]